MSLGMIQEENAFSSLNNVTGTSLLSENNETTLLATGKNDCRVVIRYPPLNEEDMSSFIGTILNPNVFWSSYSYMETDDNDNNERILLLMSAKPLARDSLKQTIRRSKKSITVVETDYQPK